MKKHYLVDTNVIIDMISAIITRNTKDFKDSSLEVIDSIEFLNSK